MAPEYRPNMYGVPAVDMIRNEANTMNQGPVTTWTKNEAVIAVMERRRFSLDDPPPPPPPPPATMTSIFMAVLIFLFAHYVNLSEECYYGFI